MKKNKKKLIWSIVVGTLLLIVGWVIWTNVNFTTTHLTITNHKISASFEGYKIAEVADLHNHQWGERLISRLEKEQPDMIAIARDFVDSSHTDFNVAMEFIEQAIGIQDPDFVERASFDGIQESIVTTKLEPLLNEDCYNIVLCHRPELFKGYVATGADLVLTGHAHGGHVRIPFVGGLIAPNQGLFPDYTEGVYHENNTDMVVSRGLGNSVIPVRINNMPELVIVTLAHS